MRTESESAAVASAATEAATLAGLAERWSAKAAGLASGGLAATEAAVIPEADIAGDIERRAAGWSHRLETSDFSELATFAAALAEAESSAWGTGDGSVATRAYADRRFLLGDRILPWAIPWFDAVGSIRCIDDARTARDALLELAERHRPAPAYGVGEGLTLAGHDGYGPTEFGDVAKRTSSLWGGVAPLGGIDGGALAALYAGAARSWSALAEDYPGSAQYWIDLAARSQRTAEMLYQE